MNDKYGWQGTPNLPRNNINNITCDSAAVAVNVIDKQEQPTECIVMNNLFIKAEKGITFNWVNDLNLTKVKSEPDTGEQKIFINCKNVDQEPVPRKNEINKMKPT